VYSAYKIIDKCVFLISMYWLTLALVLLNNGSCLHARQILTLSSNTSELGVH